MERRRAVGKTARSSRAAIDRRRLASGEECVRWTGQVTGAEGGEGRGEGGRSGKGGEGGEGGDGGRCRGLAGH